MRAHLAGVVAAFGLVAPAGAQTILYDFDNVARYSPFPVDTTVNGLTAHLTATGQGFSIQDSAFMGFTPVGFSGNCIAPSSVYAADLLVSFSKPLTDFSILYAPQELACDSSATMKVTAYMGKTLVGSNTAVADPPGTWPSATLAFTSTQAFDNVVVHYQSRPPTGGDWGPIFMADNMIVKPAPVPEPTTFAGLGVGAAMLVFLGARRRHIHG